MKQKTINTKENHTLDVKCNPQKINMHRKMRNTYLIRKLAGVPIYRGGYMNENFRK